MTSRLPTEPTRVREISLAHDYLTQRGGAERVTLALARHLQPSEIITSLYDPTLTYPEFQNHHIRTSYLQRSTILRNDPRRAFPVLPHAWRHLCSESPVTLVSSSGWAHAVRVDNGAKKIIYCHNPPRWLYQPADYFRSPLIRRSVGTILPILKRFDRRAACEADVYVANSRVVAERIKQAYGIEASVVHPPISLGVDGPLEPLNIEPGYWITVNRNRGYKNTQAIIEAVQRSKRHRLVVVGEYDNRSRSEPGASSAIHYAGRVSDEQLRWLYQNARGLVSVSHEDFGLTPLEANAFGTPSLLLRAGGFLDSLDEGVSGMGLRDDRPATILRGMDNFPDFSPDQVVKNSARFSATAFLAKIDNVIDSTCAGRA